MFGGGGIAGRILVCATRLVLAFRVPPLWRALNRELAGISHRVEILEKAIAQLRREDVQDFDLQMDGDLAGLFVFDSAGAFEADAPGTTVFFVGLPVD